jgi:hypothetical protein
VAIIAKILDFPMAHLCRFFLKMIFLLLLELADIKEFEISVKWRWHKCIKMPFSGK